MPVLIGLTALAARNLLASAKRRAAAGYTYAEGDVVWDKEKLYKCAPAD